VSLRPFFVRRPSALVRSVPVALLLGLVGLSAASGTAGCGEGYLDASEVGGQAPTFERSPSQAGAGGVTFPTGGGAGEACFVPETPTMSAGACLGVWNQSTSRVRCNPLTNEGCVDAEVCDFSASAGVFRCFPSGSTELCGACSEGLLGPFCAAGSTCRGGLGRCTRFCCGDEDCGGGEGACVAEPPSPLGICQAVSATRLSTFGVGERFGAPRLDARPRCDLPTPGPFPGACVAILGGATCNPVTNEGCPAHTACDVVPTGFACLPIRGRRDRLPSTPSFEGVGQVPFPDELPGLHPSPANPPKPSPAGAGGEGGQGGESSFGGAAGAGGEAGSGGASSEGGAGGEAAVYPAGSLCGACDDADVGGVTCGAGLHCVNGACARYCCWDDDCGGTSCDRSYFGTLGVGVCLVEAPAEAGGAGGEAGAAGEPGEEVTP
jgi:uncharacterized membrane protein YgcG